MEVESSASSCSEPSNTICEGDQVVFRRDGWSRVFQIRNKRQIYLDKSKLDIDSLIGEPYGSTFQVDRGKLVKLEPTAPIQLSIDVEQGTDNRNLLDQDSNQRMSKEDIEKMKQDGLTGQKIIEELVENSETFKTKTVFSQAKYIKKKKKKHIPTFTVLRPTPRLVLDIFSKEPAKICYLREDTLSQLLSYSNAMCGSRVGVVETCQGLVLASLLQRVGAAGRVVQLIPNRTNAVCRQVMDYLGFSKFEENVYTFPLDELNTLTKDYGNQNLTTTDANVNTSDGDATGTAMETEVSPTSNSASVCEPKGSGTNVESITDSAKVCSEKAGTTGDVVTSHSSENGDGAAKVAGEIDANKAEGEKDSTSEGGAVTGDKRQPGELGPLREAQRQRRVERQAEAGEMIRDKQLDSLVLACKYNPKPILVKMLEYLRPSASVVVFCQHIEPLVECYKQIKETHTGIQMKLSETWFREYQILPQRTHPNINMSGTGGYLLTFITCHSGSES